MKGERCTKEKFCNWYLRYVRIGENSAIELNKGNLNKIVVSNHLSLECTKFCVNAFEKHETARDGAARLIDIYFVETAWGDTIKLKCNKNFIETYGIIIKHLLLQPTWGVAFKIFFTPHRILVL